LPRAIDEEVSTGGDVVVAGAEVAALDGGADDTADEAGFDGLASMDVVMVVSAGGSTPFIALVATGLEAIVPFC
jgi:N-acetylmuramic acid 6-phosphate (MurNAc-6-P) etherase